MQPLPKKPRKAREVKGKGEIVILHPNNQFRLDRLATETPKKKRKEPYKLYSKEAIERYKKLDEEAWAMKHPIAYKEGYYSLILPTGKPSNRLNRMIVQALEWMGHEANRIDTKGTAKIDNKHAPKFDLVSGKVQYQTKIDFIPTNTKTGTEDVAARLIHPKAPYGVPWAIEGKIEDSMSPKQIERRDELHSKGLWYDVVRTLDQFWIAYDEKISLLDAL